MARPLIRRILVLLLTVLVAAGMNLYAVHAHATQIQMMDMDGAAAMVEMAMPDMTMKQMTMPNSAKCPDCDMTGKAKGAGGCVVPGCTGQVALIADDTPAIATRLAPLRHQVLAPHVLHGLAAAPDPYPPRISYIG